MMHHAMSWHWLGTVAIVAFWVLIIALALAPIKYLQAQLNSADMREPPSGEESGEPAAPKKSDPTDGVRHRTVTPS